MSDRFKLTGGSLAKEARLNPYKRISKGTEIDIVVDGEELKAIVDNAGKYTYLNVGGVDYYVSAALEAGCAYETASWTPAAPKAKAEPAEGEAAAKPRKSRKKAEAVEEAEAA